MCVLYPNLVSRFRYTFFYSNRVFCEIEIKLKEETSTKIEESAKEVEILPLK